MRKSKIRVVLENNRDLLINGYNNGMTLSELRKLVTEESVCASTIRSFLISNNIAMRPKGRKKVEETSEVVTDGNISETVQRHTV